MPTRSFEDLALDLGRRPGFSIHPKTLDAESDYSPPSMYYLKEWTGQREHMEVLGIDEEWVYVPTSWERLLDE